MRSIAGLFVFLFMFSSSLFAQDFVIEDDGLSDSIKKVLTIIPFQNNYYRSEIDRALALNEKINFDQLRDRLRNELDRQLYVALQEDYDIVSFLKDDTEEDRELLNYIFYSTASQYTQVESGEAVDRRLLANGQLIETPKQEGQSYMKTVIHHPPLLNTLQESRPSDWFLFIGELDILIPQSIDENADNRNVNVHYTLFDDEMNILDSGIITQVIPSKKCRYIKDISETGFVPIAYKFKELLSQIQ